MSAPSLSVEYDRQAEIDPQEDNTIMAPVRLLPEAGSQVRSDNLRRYCQSTLTRQEAFDATGGHNVHQAEGKRAKSRSIDHNYPI